MVSKKKTTTKDRSNTRPTRGKDLAPDAPAHAITPCRPSRKRMLTETDIEDLELDHESENEEEEDLELEIITAPPKVTPIKTPMKTQINTPMKEKEPFKSVKKLKVTPCSKIASNTPHIIIEWVPSGMKEDILLANRDGNIEEVYLSMRWYIRLIFLVKRDITVEDRKNWMMVLFDVGEQKAALVERNPTDINEPFGIKVGRKFKTYYNGLMHTLRERFDALLLMFWKAPDAQEFIEGRIAIWCATSAANARRLIGKVDEHDPVSPIIFGDELELYFFKGNLKLVTDVWSCVLDVVEQDFLLNNPDWGTRFMKCTSVILSWLITYTFKLEDPPTAIASGICTLATVEKSNAIYKGDANIVWPTHAQLRKPEAWSAKRATCPWFGELAGSKVIQDQVREELEEDIRVEIANAGPKIAVPEMTALLDCTSLDEHADYSIMELKRRIAALQELEKKSQDICMALAGRVMRVTQWMEHSKVFTENMLKGREAGAQLDRFITDVEKQYKLSQIEEETSTVEKRPLDTKTPTTLEVIGSFTAWMTAIKNQEWFKELLGNYEKAFSSNPIAYQGYSGHSGQGGFQVIQGIPGMPHIASVGPHIAGGGPGVGGVWPGFWRGPQGQGLIISGTSDTSRIASAISTAVVEEMKTMDMPTGDSANCFSSTTLLGP